MSSHRRRPRRSRTRRNRQWALWALAGMLIVGLLSSRQWLAQQAALEQAARTPQINASGPAPAPPPTEMPAEQPEVIANQPEMLPKPITDVAQGEIWRPGDVTHIELPADWTAPTRYSNPNPELISALHEAGLRPEVLRRSGNLRVQRLWEGGRSQIAVVETGVTRFGGRDWRAIYAIAHHDPELDPRLAARLVNANAASTLSAWSWDRGYWFARVLIPGNANRDSLVAAVDHVLVAADDLEKELSGSADQF